MILIFVMFLLACQPSKERQTFEVDIHTGKEGVIMKYLDKAPPDTTFENVNLPIYIELRNEGAQSAVIDYAIILEDKYIYLDRPVGNIRVEGKSVYNPSGEKEILQFDANVQSLGPEQQTYETFITTVICYPYQTLATATVCVDTDPLSTSKKKVCTPKEVKLPSGQGGPVGVSNVKTTMIPFQGTAKPIFEITLNNFQKGTLLNKARTTDACRALIGEPQDLYNIITARVYLSDAELDCTPKGKFGGKGAYVLFSPSNDKIICTLKEGIRNRGNYPAPLRMILDYGYRDVSSKKVLIKKT